MKRASFEIWYFCRWKIGGGLRHENGGGIETQFGLQKMITLRSENKWSSRNISRFGSVNRNSKSLKPKLNRMCFGFFGSVNRSIQFDQFGLVLQFFSVFQFQCPPLMGSSTTWSVIWPRFPAFTTCSSRHHHFHIWEFLPQNSLERTSSADGDKVQPVKRY